jgi:hypothetical protein
MASEHAPEAIFGCFNAINDKISRAQLSGIIGDSAHTYGYHRARNVLSPGDYSVQRSDDRLGDGWAASALDVSLSDAKMKVVTQRLIDATLANDPRLLSLREFFGTIDGVHVTGLDVRDQRWINSDDSHLWHVHLSFYRRWADDAAELLNVAAVCNGEEEDMPLSADDIEKVANAVVHKLMSFPLEDFTIPGAGTTPYNDQVQFTYRDAHRAAAGVKEILDKLP